jgi:glucose-6-phosphate 1-dehydrogenase
MVQSHVLQMTSLVAMEAPANFDATSVRNEKIKVLQSIRPLDGDAVSRSVVRGQYGPGTVNGEAVPGYREEPGVHRNSETETFVALKLLIDNWRWNAVPFYLRTGKRLARSAAEVAIQFKHAPHLVFRGEYSEANSLVLNIQPEEGISLSFGAKAPGSKLHISPVTMDFQYRRAFGAGSREAYATLINDCVRGDATLFDRADSVEAAWALVDPILDAWRNSPQPAFPNYAAGSEGPDAALHLAASDGRRWRLLP